MAAYVMKLDGHHGTVTLQGDLVALVVPELQRDLKDMVERGARELVIDLSNTFMLDSSGIGLLIAAANTLAQLTGNIHVTNVSAEIFQLLQNMRLVGRLNVDRAVQQENV